MKYFGDAIYCRIRASGIKFRKSYLGDFFPLEIEQSLNNSEPLFTYQEIRNNIRNNNS